MRLVGYAGPDGTGEPVAQSPDTPLGSPVTTPVEMRAQAGAPAMGTSVRMIERHYGALLDGAGAGIASRLDALDGRRDAAAADGG